MTASHQFLRQKRQVPNMDARYMMAEAYSSLSRAGMPHAEFEAEINNCKDSTDAYRIALGWRNKAEAQIKSGKVVS